MTKKIFLSFIFIYLIRHASKQNIFASVYTNESHYVNRCVVFVKDEKMAKDGVNIVAAITSPLVDLSDPNYKEIRAVLPDQCLKPKAVMPSANDIFRIYSTFKQVNSYVENP